MATKYFQALFTSLVIAILQLISIAVAYESRAEPSHLDLIKARDPRVYYGFEFLDRDQKYYLEWVVLWPERRIIFNVTVQTTGYVGFGLSLAGRMDGADIVVGGVRKDGTSYFSDRHGVGNREPREDASQDWVLHTARQTSSHTFLSFSRLLDTCDDKDHVINEYDTVEIIWAYGDSDLTNMYHRQNRGNYPVYLLDPNVVPRSIKESSFRAGPPSSSLLTKEGLKLWTISTSQRIPPRETYYFCSMHQAPRLKEKHHIVGFNARLETDDARQNVHHLLIYRCVAPAGQNPDTLFGPFVADSYGEECYMLAAHQGRIPIHFCSEIVTGYAIGARVAFYPDNIGHPLGENVNEYYMYQVHYDNPQRRDTVIDTHFDFFYTDKLRPHDSGTINLGHHVPGVPSMLIPPSSTNHEVYAHCSSDCTRSWLPPEGITLTFINLHTHTSGQRARVRHFRDGQELPWIGDDENYRNTFQAYRVLHRPVQILPGDHIMLRCEYDNTWLNSTVLGGFPTSQEMCISYWFYHTKINGFGLCRSQIIDRQYMQHYLSGVTNMTWDESQLEFVATSPKHLVGMTMTQITNQIPWTRQLRDELRQDQRNLEHQSTCPRSPSLPPQPGDVLSSFARYPDVPKEFTPPPRVCSLRRKSTSEFFQRDNYSDKLHNFRKESMPSRRG